MYLSYHGTLLHGIRTFRNDSGAYQKIPPGVNMCFKLPDDGDPWAPNNLLTPEQKKNTSWTPVGQATDKKLRPQPTKMNSFMSGPS